MTLKLPNSEKIIVARFSSFDLIPILLCYFKKKNTEKLLARLCYSRRFDLIPSKLLTIPYDVLKLD